MSLLQTQKLFHELCFAQDFSCTQKSLESFIDRDQAGFFLSQAKERHLVYRELVENNVHTVLATCFATLFQILPSGECHFLIRDFLNRHKIRSNIYRHIARDFLDYLYTFRPAPLESHPQLVDLADYEWHSFDLGFKENYADDFKTNPDLVLESACLVLNPHLYLKSYNTPVHTITSLDALVHTLPAHTYLLLYRHPTTFAVHTQVLNSLSYKFLDYILAHPEKNLRNILEFIFEGKENGENQILTDDLLKFVKSLLDKRIVLALVDACINKTVS